jgi:tetratricopeptide (TPR) repeat protein
MTKSRPSSKSGRRSAAATSRGGSGSAQGGGPARGASGGGSAGGGSVRRPRRIRLDPIATALFAFALAIRLWGIGDRLPDPTLGINVLDDSAVEETDRTTMMRAWTMWNGGTKDLDLNPHTGGWPGFSFYFGLGIQMGYKVVYSASHPGASPSDFVTHVHEHSNQMFLFGRVVNALVGALTVYLAFLLGSTLLGRAAGLGAAILLALNPLHILISQHIADPNLLALLFVLLASMAMTRIVDGRGGGGGGRGEGSRSDGVRDSVIAGAMIGLAGASKYIPLVLVVPLAVAHGREFYRDRRFYFALAAVAVAMFVASPYTFLDWKTTIRDMTTQRKALFSDWVGQTAFPFSLPTYLVLSLPHAMGWPAYLLGLVGMGFLWREGKRAHPVALVPAVMVLANGALRAAQERYVLVAIPILFLGTALAIRQAWAWMRSRGAASALADASSASGGARSAPAVATATLLGALAVAWPLPEFIALRHSLALPDTRHLARRWINQNIGADHPMAIELYGPVFQPDERAMVIWPFFATQAPLARPAYHKEWLDGLEYYVLSREISRRFEADSASYPVEVAYYRWIRSHAPIVWETDPKTSSGPEIEIRRIPVSVSTRAERDTLFAHIMPVPSRVNRLALWCVDTANLFGRLSQFDRAEEWARRGLRVDGWRLNPRLWGTLSYLLLNKNQFAAAESAAARGIALAPGEGSLRLYHGMALAELGRKQDALEEYENAYGITGDDRVILNIGSTLVELGRYEEAVTVLSKVGPDSPSRGAARRDMAVILINQLNRPVEGLDALHEAASLITDPTESKALRDEAARIEGLMRKGAGAGGGGGAAAK